MKKYTEIEQESIRIQKEYLASKRQTEKPIYDLSCWIVNFVKNRNLKDSTIEISCRRHIYNEVEKVIKDLCQEVKK